MNYFTKCKTLDELKAENRSVANYVECLVLEALGEKRLERKNDETNHSKKEKT